MNAGGMFEPLPPEPARATRRRDEARPRPVIPVPADAPPPPRAHPTRDVPSRVWEYRNAAGELLGYRCRFERTIKHSRKEVLPLTFREYPNGRRCWAWLDWDAPRALYGLDRVAARPAAVVIICEGEKTADAAGTLFSDHVAITSPGGAGAADKADWLPLRGRRVVVWPDADAPGATYAADVVRLARAACAADVRRVALPADLSDGWDLADPLPDGWTLHALRELLASARPVVEAACELQDWPALQLLPDALPEVPALPLELIPAPLRDWTTDAVDRLQVPAEMVAVPSNVSAAALVGRTVGILPKRYDDWLVVPNLWGIIIGRPGTLKSPAVREGTRHLRRLAAVARERHESALPAAHIEADLLDAQLTAAKRAAARLGADLEAIRAELTRLAGERAAAVPVERRYYTSDPTIEKLGELLLANPRGLLLMRDELAGWLRTLERSGREGDREFFLESWNGDGAYTVDRIGRGTLHISGLCLSVLGTTQPGKLRSYLAAATDGGAGDDGLMQRFQLAVWPDVSGEWCNVDRLPDSAACDRAARVYAALDVLTAERIGATAHGDGIPALRFGPAAQELFDSWRVELETRLRTPELMRHPAYEAHAAKYRSLMPALALLFHLVDLVDGRVDAGPVGLDAARTAATWCDYLDGHARRLYAVELDPGRTTARALADRIESRDVVDGDTLRGVQQHEWSGLRTVDLVRAGATVLEARGWLRIERRDTRGRPSELLRLHPALRGDA